MPFSSTFSSSPTIEEVNPWLSSRNSSNADQIGDEDSSESEPEDVTANQAYNTTLSSQWHAYARAHTFSGNERLLIGA